MTRDRDAASAGAAATQSLPPTSDRRRTQSVSDVVAIVASRLLSMLASWRRCTSAAANASAKVGKIDGENPPLRNVSTGAAAAPKWNCAGKLRACKRVDAGSASGARSGCSRAIACRAMRHERLLLASAAGDSQIAACWRRSASRRGVLRRFCRGWRRRRCRRRRRCWCRRRRADAVACDALRALR